VLKLATTTVVTWVTANNSDYLMLYLPITACACWPDPTEPNSHMQVKKLFQNKSILRQGSLKIMHVHRVHVNTTFFSKLTHHPEHGWI